MNLIIALKYYLEKSNEPPSRRIRFIVRSFLNFHTCNTWYSYIIRNLKNSNTQFVNNLFEQLHRKHFDSRLNVKQVSDLLINHYTLLQIKTSTQTFIQLTELKEVCLAKVKGKLNSYYITLGIDFQFSKEGNLALKLYKNNIRLVCISFSLAYIDTKEAMLIGCIQSTNQNTLENLRQSTKDLYGKQPRLLLIKAIQLISNKWNLKTIKAIDTKNHPYKTSKSKSERIQIDYADLWKLLGGTITDDGNYFLPNKFELKNIQMCRVNKRAQFKQQNELLLNLQKQINLSHL